MFSRIREFNKLLQVYGRLRVSKLGLLGGISVVVVFTGLFGMLMLDWVWYQIFGQVMLPGHEIFGEKPDLSFLIPLPLAWLAFQVVKGRLLLTDEVVAKEQEQWDDVKWALWESKGVHSISNLNFMLCMFGVVSLLCLAGALVWLAEAL